LVSVKGREEYWQPGSCPRLGCWVQRGWSTFQKGRFEEATRVTGKMVQVHHGAATVSGE